MYDSNPIVFVHKATVEAQRVPGLQKSDSCLCKINSSMWTFPTEWFVEVTKQVQTYEDNLYEFEEKVSVKLLYNLMDIDFFDVVHLN